MIVSLSLVSQAGTAASSARWSVARGAGSPPSRTRRAPASGGRRAFPGAGVDPQRPGRCGVGSGRYHPAVTVVALFPVALNVDYPRPNPPHLLLQGANGLQFPLGLGG